MSSACTLWERAVFNVGFRKVSSEVLSNYLGSIRGTSDRFLFIFLQKSRLDLILVP